ncbi:MAG: hypothetical protein J2P21_13205 [Chloracidobacterium sp.]|nr:hypothetical protein [Chloracidobacterium sp.]
MARLGQEFELKINQEAMIEGEGLAIAIESALEDGRCPLDVTCAWSGNAKIKVRLSTEKQRPAGVELITHLRPQSSSRRPKSSHSTTFYFLTASSSATCRVRLSRPIEGQSKQLRITRRIDGWYAYIVCEIPKGAPLPPTRRTVGLAQAISDAAWGSFFKITKRKAENAPPDV